MILWIIFAFMAAIVAGAVFYALRPGVGSATEDTSRPDLAVYKDQLATIEIELENGLLEENEAKAARVEVSRRLLAASKVCPDGVGPGATGAARRGLAFICAFGVVAASLGTYILTGSPNLPDQPFFARNDRPPEAQDMATLVGRMELHLEENPDDGRGWDLLAPIYSRLGRPGDAARAYGEALRVEGVSAPRFAGLGEALVQANNGAVTGDARSAFADSLALDPTALRPKFFLIVAQEQDGELGTAIESWRVLLQETPEDVPWREAVVRRVAMLEARLNGAPDPSEEQVRDAGERTPEERQQMIEGMVTQLAARLSEDGDDIDGWLRLIQSYVVLGRPGEAKTALADAREQFRQDEISLDRLTRLANNTGLDAQ